MLIGNVLEKTNAEAAWQLCADKLGDWVRTSWQDHVKAGDKQWEDAFHEDPNALPGLRVEGFKGLVEAHAGGGLVGNDQLRIGDQGR